MLDKIIEIFEKNSDKIAYIINNEKITYNELLKKSLSISNLLKKQGNAPIIIYGHKSVDMVISIISCLLAKRTYIPVDIHTPISRMQKIIDMTNASLIIKNEEIDITFDIENIALNELNKYENHQEKLIENEIAYMIFTSGSTGEPKGVPISYSNLNNFISWISNFNVLSNYSNIVVMNQASFSFDLSVADFYYSLINGHTLVALDKDSQNDYNKIFQVIKKNKVNLIVATPTFMKLCIINPFFNKTNFPFINCTYLCGERLEKELVEKMLNSFPNLNIINAYGPTEATSAISAILIDKNMLLKEEILPVGVVDDLATELTIHDDEIILKGNSVFSGYLNNHIGGYYKEDGKNCYKTGDIGYIKDKKIYCCGRKDRQIKYKGYRIELDEIETSMYSIDGIKECAVIAKYDNNKAVKLIKAFVVLDDKKDVDYVKLQLKELIPEYMIPKIIKKIEKMPINKNGKIDRKLLIDL